MVLPIFAYGQPVLKKEGIEISNDYPDLKTLISNMFETMYEAEGVGLAAPQIGLSIKLFVVDTIQTEKEKTKGTGIKKAFINPVILEEDGDIWAYDEGCLSIPDIRGEVERHPNIQIKYFDEDFNEHIESYSGVNARVIQHEYDHIMGILFIEHLGPLKKQMIKRRLDNIRKGSISVDYRMKFVSTR